MPHIKSALTSDFFKKLSERANSQDQIRQDVLSLLPPVLQKDILGVSKRDVTYYIAVRSNYAIVAIKHALKNLGHPYKVYMPR